jgi:hypothetical protein
MRKDLIFLGLLVTPFLGILAFGGQGQPPAAKGEQAVRKAVTSVL